MMTPPATPPHLDGGPIRVVRNHDIYRGADRCPTCGSSTDLFMTGTGERGGDGVWTWRRPHPRCVVAALRRGGRAVPGIAWRGIGALSLGRVRVAAGLVDFRPDVFRRALARHRAGNFGAFGSLDEPEPGDLDPWCPGVFGVAARNRLTLRSGVGLIVSRFTLDPNELDIAILTALDGSRSATVVVPSERIPAEVLQEELPPYWQRFYAGGTENPAEGVDLTRRRSGTQRRDGVAVGLAALVG